LDYEHVSRTDSARNPRSYCSSSDDDSSGIDDLTVGEVIGSENSNDESDDEQFAPTGLLHLRVRT